MAKLTDESELDFQLSKKYGGQKLKDIPYHFFIWYKTNIAPTYANQDLHDYIKENWQVLMKEQSDANAWKENT